jgi:hypothetical protein
VRDADLSLGDDARRDVDDDGLPARRDRDGDRIRRELRIGPAPWRDARDAVAVAEELRDEPARRGFARVNAGAADVIGVAHGDRGASVLARLRNRELERALRDDLAPRVVAIEERRRARVADERRLGARVDSAELDIAPVLREPDDAVRIVSCEVRADQVLGDDRRAFIRRAHRAEDAFGALEETDGGEARHGSLLVEIGSFGPGRVQALPKRAKA